MPRVIWKGAISFSLIHIPVSLHSATRANELDLDLLDRRDFSPVGYQRVNKSTGRAVEWDDIVKGYQYEKGQYVVLTEEDFRQANVEATQTIDIRGFVEEHAIVPCYFETPYYLAPEKRGEKVYLLLRDALQRSHRIAIALVVIRTRQYVAALYPYQDVLMLNTLRYADEILPADDFRAAAKSKGQASTSGKELQMALKLVAEMSEPWQPEAYSDTYRNDLMKRIEKKVAAGQTKTLTESARSSGAQSSTKVVDLMSLLKRSLAEKHEPAGSPRTSAAKPTQRHARARHSRGTRQRA